MNAIHGKPEGREGVWLITPDTACRLIEETEGDTVHNFIGHGAVYVGADWTKEEFRDFITKDGLKIALVFPPNETIGHHLVAINNERRWAFDIGSISEDRMRRN